VYVNTVKVAGGPFDVQLVFGLSQPASVTATNEAPTIDEVVRVAMSWAHAKAMIPILAKVVADYESKVGEVPAPGFEDQWRA
jgi:hypothetical protein